MRIYVASSWRNDYQPKVVSMLRAIGQEVYDFRNPQKDGGGGFQWKQVEKPGYPWEEWTTYEYLQALRHPIAIAGFQSDMDAMEWADAFILVTPHSPNSSGRSSHLEFGWAVGKGKRTCIFIPERIEPDLMYKMADQIADSAALMLEWVKETDAELKRGDVQ